MKLNKVIILTFLVIACLKSLANDTAKINLSIILKNINSKNTLGLYLLDNKEENNIIDFKIISFPYIQTFYINKIENPLIKIFAQGVNFTSDTIYLNITEKKEYDVSLIVRGREKNMELPEIIVSTKKNNNNDTISFKAEKYVTQNTFKTEDLISNIEGFRVDEDGKIYYNNKPITKVMINGDNLSGDNYTLITKNLNSKTVKDIQVIKNENNNRILSSVQKSSDVAINLVLKKQTPKFNPNIDIAFANKNRYLMNFNALGLLKKTKIFTFLNTNTIGEKPLSLDEESKNTNDAAEQNSLSKNNIYSQNNVNFLNGSRIGRPSLPFKYIDNNKDHLNGAYITYRLSSKATLNAEIISVKNSNINSALSKEIYDIPNSPQQIITTNKTSNLRHLTDKYQLYFNYDSKSKLIIRSSFNYRITRNSDTFFDLSNGSFSDELKENINQNKHDFTYINYLTYKLNTQDALLINTKNSFSSIYEGLDGNTNRLNTFFNSTNNNLNLINQNINYKLNKNLISLNLIHSKKKNYNVGINFENFIFNPSNSIYFQNSFKQKNEDDLKLSQISTSLKSTVNFSNNFNFSLDGLIGISKLSSQNSNIFFQNKLSYGIITKLQTKEKVKLAIEISLNIRAYLPDIFSLSNLNYLSSINQINYPSKFNSLLKENSISMAISKRDLVKGSFSFNTSFFYNPSNITNNFIFSNGLFQNKLEIVKNNYGNNSNLNLERYSFLFRSKFFLDINTGYSSLNQLQNNELQNLKILTSSLTFKTVTNFKKLTNFEIQILYNNNLINQATANKSFSVKNYGVLVKNLSAVSKKIMMGNTFKFFKYNNALPIYLQHLSLGYVTKKKNIKIELLLHNIWAYKYFTIIQNSFFNYSESSFELVPRYLLLKTSFQF